MLRLLIVEDTPAVRKRVERFFTETVTGYEVAVAGSRDEALARLTQSPPDAIVLDLVIPAGPKDTTLDPAHGEAVLTLARRLRPQTRVVVFSAESQLTRDFLKVKGANDFFTKDSPEAWQEEKLPAQVSRLIGHLACRSEAMQALRAQLTEVDDAERCVLVTGPAGAGKRHVARVLHLNSPAADAPLVERALVTLTPEDVLAAARAEGLGTLVLAGLEHVELLPRGTQACLAALLAETASQPRLVLVASVAPQALLEAGTLLPECAAALRRVRHLRVPGLADRVADLGELAECFRREAAIEQGRPVREVSDPALRGLEVALHEGRLPGETAELRELIRRAVSRAEGESLQPSDLGLALTPEFTVVRCAGGAVTTERLSAPEVDALTANPALPLVLHAQPDGDGWRVDRLRLGAEQRAVDDERVGRLLFLLAVQPGQVVEVRPLKRRLGLLEHEQARRYVFLLRQLLDDTEFEGRNSRFVASHYGEAYSFSLDTPYCLIRRLPNA